MRPRSNNYLHAAVLSGIGIQLTAAWLPFLSSLLGNAAVPVELWVVIMAAAFLSWGMAELVARSVWRSVVQNTPA